MKQDQYGSTIEITGPDVPGLLACLTGHLASRAYDIHSTAGEALSRGMQSGGIRDTFVVTRYNQPLLPDERDSLCASLTELADGLERASRDVKKVSQKYAVDVVDGEVDGATVLVIEGPDASGLLGAITSTLSESSCSIVTFSGETLPTGLVRDRFVVQIDGQPVGSGPVSYTHLTLPTIPLV